MSNEEMLQIILYQTIANRYYINFICKYLLSGEDIDKYTKMLDEAINKTWRKL